MKTIPEVRLHRYRVIANAQSVDVAELYRWNGQVALANFDDLGEWIAENTSLPGVLVRCPLPDKSVLRI